LYRHRAEILVADLSGWTDDNARCDEAAERDHLALCVADIKARTFLADAFSGSAAI
jgi:hypothetical protein